MKDKEAWPHHWQQCILLLSADRAANLAVGSINKLRRLLTEIALQRWTLQPTHWLGPPHATSNTAIEGSDPAIYNASAAYGFPRLSSKPSCCHLQNTC